MNHSQPIIIGQGFAGTATAWKLYANNKPFQIYDQGLNHSSSIVSAGIINPLTGLRLTHNEKYITYKQCCDEFYHTIEQILDTKFYHSLRILKLLTRPEEIEAWEKKHKQYVNIAREIKCPAELQSIMKNTNVPCVEIQGSMIDAPTYLKKSRAFFKQNKYLKEEPLTFTADNLSKIKTPHIFCEGVHSANNPLFPNLPFINAKGEILTITADLSDLASTMINTDIFILAIREKTFRVGATYEWNDLSTTPTEKGKIILTNKIEKHFKFPYTIINHHAGVRPILKDQKPLLDQHPENSQAYILTGLGSKGALYSPFLSSVLFDHLYGGKKLQEEFQLNRFTKQ